MALSRGLEANSYEGGGQSLDKVTPAKSIRVGRTNNDELVSRCIEAAKCIKEAKCNLDKEVQCYKIADPLDCVQIGILIDPDFYDPCVYLKGEVCNTMLEYTCMFLCGYDSECYERCTRIATHCKPKVTVNV